MIAAKGGNARSRLPVRRAGAARRTTWLVRKTGRALWNLRHGRAQQMFSVATAASALPLGLEVYVNHYGGSFSNKWMWAPVGLLPALGAAGLAGVRSPTVANTALPALGVATTATGLAGTYLHGRGVMRKPGGLSQAGYNLVQGPPLLAPGSLTMVGAIGIAAALMRRERW